MLNTRAPKFNPPVGRGGLGLRQPITTQPVGQPGFLPPGAGMDGFAEGGPRGGALPPADAFSSGMNPQGPVPTPGPGTQMPPADPQAMNALARVMTMRR